VSSVGKGFSLESSSKWKKVKEKNGLKIFFIPVGVIDCGEGWGVVGKEVVGAKRIALHQNISVIKSDFNFQTIDLPCSK